MAVRIGHYTGNRGETSKRHGGGYGGRGAGGKDGRWSGKRAGRWGRSGGRGGRQGEGRGGGEVRDGMGSEGGTGGRRGGKAEEREKSEGREQEKGRTRDGKRAEVRAEGGRRGRERGWGRTGAGEEGIGKNPNALRASGGLFMGCISRKSTCLAADGQLSRSSFFTILLTVFRWPMRAKPVYFMPGVGIWATMSWNSA